MCKKLWQGQKITTENHFIHLPVKNTPPVTSSVLTAHILQKVISSSIILYVIHYSNSQVHTCPTVSYSLVYVHNNT